MGKRTYNKITIDVKSLEYLKLFKILVHTSTHIGVGCVELGAFNFPS